MRMKGVSIVTRYNILPLLYGVECGRIEYTALAASHREMRGRTVRVDGEANLDRTGDPVSGVLRIRRIELMANLRRPHSGLESAGDGGISAVLREGRTGQQSEAQRWFVHDSSVSD